MKKFLVIYHAPAKLINKMANASPADAIKGMEPWIVWQKTHEKNIVDLGLPTGNGKHVTKDGSTPSVMEVAGYSVIQANSMEEALGIVKAHPHLFWGEGVSLEVYETFALPGMQ